LTNPSDREVFAPEGALHAKTDGDMRGEVRCAICAALLMAMAVPMPAAAHTRPGAGDPVVQTRQGAARGLTTDGADKFLGLP
jgi:hypothetical protein